MTDNAELIAEARDFVQMGSGINVVEADRLIEELSRELEAAEKRAEEAEEYAQRVGHAHKECHGQRDQLAAVVEKVRRVGTKTPELIDILATAPAAALREHDARVWDEAIDAASEQGTIQLPDNPYRKEQS